jgi:predicted nucleotidyltransferase component of viral defense system
MIQPAIQNLIDKYHTSSLKKRDIVREILQQAALLGLARLQFFEHAAFYGGTALRILYGLDRFSEDLDFSLLKPDPQFNFQPFLEGLQREMESLGFHVEVSAKKKEPSILSAFVKGNTLKFLLTIEEAAGADKDVQPEEKIAIKLEIDTKPPLGFEVETKLVLNPTPFYVLTYCPGDLFAGKMHAILCRKWKNRIKGRDWYDLVWFIRQGTPIHLAHLSHRLRQSGHLIPEKELDKKTLLAFLQEKIRTIDWESAKNDVRPFVLDPKVLDIWSSSFFLDLIPHIKTQ